MASLSYAPRLRTPSIRRTLVGQPALATPGRGIARLTAQPVASRAMPSSLVGVRPSRQIILPSQPIAATSGTSGTAKKEDKGVWGGLLSSIGNVVSFPGTVIKSLPTIIGKAGQSLYGLGETVFDVGADIINPNLYTSRSEVDLAKGRKLGLTGPELLAYSMQRTVPLIAPMVSSFPRTVGNIAETATAGSPTFKLLTGKPYLDTGEKGLNVYNALRQGQLGTMVLEDLGNIMIAGRMAGLGNLGVVAGERLAESGMPALGRTIATAGRFSEEPIATTARGAARLGLKLDQFGRPIYNVIQPGLSKIPLVSGRISEPTVGPLRRQTLLSSVAESERPLKTAVTGISDRIKIYAEDAVKRIDEEYGAKLRQREEGVAANTLFPEEVSRLDGELKKLEQRRNRIFNLSQTSRSARRLVAEGQRSAEAQSTMFTQLFTRFNDQGSVPETVQNLKNNATQLRERIQSVSDPVEKTRLAALADDFDLRARVKESDTTGKLGNQENRKVNFSAAMIVVSKLIDQIMLDRRAGFSLDEIMARIQPKELFSEAERLGYGYTPESVQRAIDFVEGNLDAVDSLDMNMSSRMLASVADHLENAATSGTFVTGKLSPAQLGDSPVPEIFLSELESRGFAKRVFRQLDLAVVEVITTMFAELASKYEKELKNPEGLFKKLAEANPDSSEYAAAYVALKVMTENLSNPETSIFANDPNLSLQVAEFFQNPAIYAARMRPMLAYRESAQMAARGADVVNVLDGMKSLVERMPEVLSEGRLAKLNGLLEELQNPRRRFDRDFWIRTQNLVSGILKDVANARTKLSGKIGESAAKIAESDARLSEIEAQARAAAGMVEQALFRPEELSTTLAPTVPDTERAQVVAETERLANLRSKQQEANTRIQDVESRLATEENILRQASMPPDEIPVLLAEMDAAQMARSSGVDAEPSLAQQKAWKQDQVNARQSEANVAFGNVGDMFRGGEIDKIARESLWTEDYWTTLKRILTNDVHFRKFFEELTRSKYAEGAKDYIPTKAELAPKDLNEGKLVRANVEGLDAVAADGNQIRGGFASEGEWLAELARRWKIYMDAMDQVREAKRTPLSSKNGLTVRDAMRAERAASMDNVPWQNPNTGGTEYGIRTLEELQRIYDLIDDRDAFAAQVRVVEELRKERDASVRQAQELGFQARQLDERISGMTAKMTEVAPVVARPRGETPKQRLTYTTPAGKTGRLVTPKLSETEPGKIDGYTFTNGVAKKLDSAERAELRVQQKQTEVIQDLQAKLNEQDRLKGEAETVKAGAQEYRGSLAGPTGSSILRAADRPLLAGETAQPTWIPVGEAGGVRPTAKLDVRLVGEGMAPETKMSIERQRTSTFMAQTPAEFADRLREILGQLGRNKVVNTIITNQEVTSDVKTILDSALLERLQAQAEKLVDDQGIDRNTREFDAQVKQEFGDLVIRELAYAGYEPVSPVRMPDPSDPYAGRAPVGNLSQIVKGDNITPETLVMRKGLRESIASYYEPAGGSKLPPIAEALFKTIQKKTSQWKSVVLPFSTRWQVGDAMGNVINAWVRAGISPIELTRLVLEVDKRLREPTGMGVREMLGTDVFSRPMSDPVMEVIMGAGLQSRGLRLRDLEDARGGKLRPSQTAKTPVSKLLLPGIREKSFIFNETQNGIVRAAVALGKLEEELQTRGRTLSEIDPVTIHNDPVLYESVQSAVAQANDALGAFSQLTPYEKNYIRTIYPFWSWLKFINKAAADLLVSQPDRVLFYAHLGSLALGDDGNDLYDWLKNQTAVRIPGYGVALMDLSFMNPYTDAIIFGRNIAEEAAGAATSVSPLITAATRTAGEIAYGLTGREFPLLNVGARPGYLEGRPGSTTRSLGDVLGGIGYQNFRTFAGPLRFLTEVAPTVRVPGTDVLLGPGPRYQQGSPRTTGLYSKPLLSPTQQRIGAILRGFGVPMPSARLTSATTQGKTIGRNEADALRRRQQQRRLSRIGR
jgi:hypothetical protein